MNKKYYVTNGQNKRVLMATSEHEAALLQVEEILSQFDPEEDEVEKFEFWAFSFVSEYGFYQDIVAINNEDQLDKCVVFKTSTLLETLGRKDIADGIKEFEKTLDPKMQAFLNAIEE